MDISEALGKTKKESAGGLSGILLGYPQIDHAIGGLRPGNIMTFMAKTSVGKTWWALNVLKNICEKYHEKNIAFFSLDMLVCSLIERIEQLYSGKSRNELSPKNDSATSGMLEESLRRVEFFEGNHTDEGIAKEISRLSATGIKKPEIVYIDYFGLIGHAKSNNQQIGPYEEASAVMKKLKQIAQEKKFVLFLLTQLSRKAEGGNIPVTIDMARDSGVIEELSDFILGAWRLDLDETKKIQPKFKDKIFIKLLKNKNGETVLTICSFDKKTGQMKELGADAVEEILNSKGSVAPC